MDRYRRRRRLGITSLVVSAAVALGLLLAGPALAAPTATASPTTNVTEGTVISVNVDGSSGYDGAGLIVVTQCGNATTDGTPLTETTPGDCFGPEAFGTAQLGVVLGPVDGTDYSFDYPWVDSGIGANDATCIVGGIIDCAISVTLIDNITDQNILQTILIPVFPPDVDPPVVSLVSPPDGSLIEQGQIVLADYSCSDAETGMASCTGDVPVGQPIDTATAGAKTFTVTGTDNAGNATVVTHDYTVAALPEITPGVINVAEGDTGTVVADVPVTLSGPAGVEVTVDWSTADWTAAAPEDYVADQGTITFAPGEIAKTVPITVNSDALYEDDEYLGVVFSNPTNATLGGFMNLGLVAINDDDPQPTVTPGGFVANPEGDTGSTTWNLPLTLSAPAGVPVSIDYSTLDIPTNPRVAHPGSDYVATSGTISFAPGETVKNIPIEILGDTDDEPPLLYGEWGLVELSNPVNTAVTGGLFGLGLFIIIDDD